MKIFGYEVTVSRPTDRAASGLTQRSGGEVPIDEWVRGNDYGTTSYTNAFTQVSFVYRAVTALAEQVANIPFRFASATEGKDRITTGRLHDFYRRPHPSLNGFQYWELRVLWLLLRGECFRIPVFQERNGKQVLDRVMMLDPVQFRHVVEDGKLVAWQYRSYGSEDPAQSQIFLPEEVWYERLPNPFDPWRGLSPLTVAAAPSSGEYAASQWMKGLMENNGNAGLVVRTDEVLDPEQREQLKQALRERRRGIGRADGPLLLWGGAEVMQPKAAAADLQLIEHRKFSLAEICSAFGVPEEIVTSVNAAKYDVMKGARLSFVENRVVPLCRRLEAEEQVCIRSIEPGAKGFFEVEEHPVLATARRDRLKTAQAGFAMGIPLNELNRSLDLGFKPLPWGDVGYIPRGMLRVES